MSSDPDMKLLHGHPSDEFLITASDGLWDVISSQEAVDFVNAVTIADLFWIICKQQ